jgi:hypothetical protein
MIIFKEWCKAKQRNDSTKNSNEHINELSFFKMEGESKHVNLKK